MYVSTKLAVFFRCPNEIGDNPRRWSGCSRRPRAPRIGTSGFSACGATRDRCSTPRSAAARRALIVDCGTGTGRNLDWLRQYGLAVGVELSPVGLRLGRARRRPAGSRHRDARCRWPTASADLVDVVRRAVLPRRRERGASHCARCGACSNRAASRSSTSRPSTSSAGAHSTLTTKCGATRGRAWAPGSNRPDSGSSA